MDMFRCSLMVRALGGGFIPRFTKPLPATGKNEAEKTFTERISKDPLIKEKPGVDGAYVVCVRLDEDE